MKETCVFLLYNFIFTHSLVSHTRSIISVQKNILTYLHEGGRKQMLQHEGGRN